MQRAEHRSIEINIYIHRFIEKHRRYFGEPDCEILERAIRLATCDVGLGSERSVDAETAKKTKASGRPYFGDGYVLEHGERLEMEYNDQPYRAEIVDGAWRTENGTVCYSPSAAARDVARTRTGKKTHLNGLLYWRVNREGGSIALSELAGRQKPIAPLRVEDL